ncbi:MAG TPA: sigma-70 family RNA polymerase sigma factor [Planctomycetota bacterium]|nr:sigma-70 family RNA polymerase sigma factor [Planctomycetota bacterium]
MADDRDAVRELLAGGRSAWDRFARDTRLVVLKAVHTAARRFRASEADVEDAASQVFIELFQDDAKAIRAYRGESALTTWLTVVAYRIATREFVRHIRAREVEAAKPVPVPVERDREVLETLEKLPELDRRALVMFHVDDCSYKEISDQLSVPLNQVGMVLLRAREKLAKVLKPSAEE